MEFTHFDPGGKAWMVDVSDKENTKREAVAEGVIRMSRECFEQVKQGSAEKGDVLGTARIAGIMGAKKTPELIPLCHILGLTKLSVDFDLLPDEHAVRARCTAGTVGKTGAEMEALTGVSCALLTVYDMCKAVDKAMEIGEIRLIRKSGGKSGEFVNPKAGGDDPSLCPEKNNGREYCGTEGNDPGGLYQPGERDGETAGGEGRFHPGLRD